MDRKRLYLLLPVRCIIFFLIFTLGAHIAGKTTDEVSSWWSIAASIVNILMIILLAVAAKRRGGSYRELINYRKGHSRSKRMIIFITVLVVTGMSGMLLSGLLFYGTLMPEASLRMTAPVPVVLAAANMLVLPVSSALAEDGLYLGAGTGSIENKFASVAVPAFFYAVQHCFIPLLFDIRYMAFRALSFLPLTVIFCIYYRKKKDPLPLMASHAILDFATASSILAMSISPGAYEQMADMIK